MDIGSIRYTVEADTTDLDRADARMDQAGESARGMGRSAERAGRDVTQAGRRTRTATAQMERGFNGAAGSVARLRTALLTLTGVLATFGAGFGLRRVITDFADFEQTMLGVQAVSGATENQFQALSKQARELGATTAFSAKQAAQGQRFLAQAGFDVNETLAATPGILELASAGQMDLARAADIASNVLGGMRLEVDQINRVNDVLAQTASSSNTNVEMLGSALSFAAPIAASAGVSIEELSAAVGVLSDAGVQGTRAGTGMLGVIRQLVNATPEAEKALRRYGLTLEDVNIEQNGLATVMSRINEAGIDTASMFQIFGTRAGNAAQILANGSGRLEEFTGELENAEGRAQEMALLLESGLSGSMRTFNSVTSESILRLSESGLAGAFESLLDKSSGVISVWNGMIDQFAEVNDLSREQKSTLETTALTIQVTAGAVGSLTAAYVTATVATWAWHASQVALNRVIRANPYVLAASAIVAVTGALYSARNATVAFGETSASIMDWLRGTWRVTMQRIVDNSETAFDAAGNAVEGVRTRSREIIPQMGQLWLTMYENMWGGAKAAVNGIIGTLHTLDDTMRILSETIWEGFSAAFQRSLNVAVAFWEDLQSILSGDLSFSGVQESIARGFVAPWENAVERIGQSWDRNMNRDYIGDSIGFIANEFQVFGRDVSDTTKTIVELREQADWARAQLGKMGAECSESSEALAEALAEVEKRLGEAGESTDELGNSFAELRDRLRPLEAAQRDYLRDKATLVEYAERENLSAERLSGLLSDLKNEYEETRDRIVGVTDEAEQMGETTSRALENIQRGLADVFVDAMDRGIRSFKDGLQVMVDSFKRVLAEMAAAAAMTPIRVAFGLDGGMGSTLGGSILQNVGGRFGNLFGAGGNSVAGAGTAAAGHPAGGMAANSAFTGGTAGGNMAMLGSGAAAAAMAGFIASQAFEGRRNSEWFRLISGARPGSASADPIGNERLRTGVGRDFDPRDLSRDPLASAVTPFGRLAISGQNDLSGDKSARAQEMLSMFAGIDQSVAQAMGKELVSQVVDDGILEGVLIASARTFEGGGGQLADTQGAVADVVRARLGLIFETVSESAASAIRGFRSDDIEEVTRFGSALGQILNYQQGSIAPPDQQTGAEVFREQSQALREMTRESDGSLESMERIAEQTRTVRQMELELLGQIEQAGKDIEAIFKPTLDSLRRGGLDGEELHRDYEREIDAIVQSIPGLKSAGEVVESMREVNRLVNDWFGTLDPSQQNAQRQDTIDFVEGVKAMGDLRLEELGTSIAEEREKNQQDMGTFIERMGEMGDINMEAAQTQREAAREMLLAANTMTDAANTLSNNAASGQSFGEAGYV